MNCSADAQHCTKALNVGDILQSLLTMTDETEKQIFQTIKNLKNKKTIIVVTHKTELLSDADKLMVIKNGEVSIQ